MKSTTKKGAGWWSWCGCCDSGGGTVLWGLLVIVIGGYYLARDMGWIPRDVALWPIVLITIGVGMFIGNIRRWKQ